MATVPLLCGPNKPPAPAQGPARDAGSERSRHDRPRRWRGDLRARLRLSVPDRAPGFV